MTLMNRFKEFKRTPVRRNESSTKRKSPKKKMPGITQGPRKPVFSPGEDAISLERHSRILNKELKKVPYNVTLLNFYCR